MSAVCDICSRPEIVWTYDAEDYTVPDVSTRSGREWGSAGAWAMCDDCSEAYEAGGPAALTRRAMEAYDTRIPAAVRDEIELRLGELHRDFHVRRRGPRRKAEDVEAGCEHEWGWLDDEASDYLQAGWYCRRCGKGPRATVPDRTHW